jgi:hypothetical protein
MGGAERSPARLARRLTVVINNNKPNGMWRRTRALERAVTTASRLHEASVPIAQRRALGI